MTTSSNTFYFKDNEAVNVIIIQFKPSGFWALLRLDMEELTNLLPNFSLLTSASESSSFIEQLLEAKSFNEQVIVLDNFFLKKLMLHSNNNDQNTGSLQKFNSHKWINEYERSCLCNQYVIKKPGEAVC